MTDFLEHWATENPENARLVAQELLITEVTEAIWEAMEHTDVTKSELAIRMGATKGYVSQVLKGSRNMTLRTLSDICFALGRKPMFSVEREMHGSEWQTCATAPVAIGPAKLRYQRTGNVVFPTGHWDKAA